MDTAEPVVIEAAITPLRWDEPARTVEQMISEGGRCIGAGAGIIHHHHDMRLDPADATDALLRTALGIREAHPQVLSYTDYLRGKSAWQENVQA